MIHCPNDEHVVALRRTAASMLDIAGQLPPVQDRLSRLGSPPHLVQPHGFLEPA
jgi:hypothetical protein